MHPASLQVLAALPCMAAGDPYWCYPSIHIRYIERKDNYGKTALETRQYALSGTGSYGKLRQGGGDAEHHYGCMGRHHSHVTGQAVDIGPPVADDWLIANGSRFGLCRTYANELWHFELATEPGGVCPPLLPDASS